MEEDLKNVFSTLINLIERLDEKYRFLILPDDYAVFKSQCTNSPDDLGWVLFCLTEYFKTHKEHLDKNAWRNWYDIKEYIDPSCDARASFESSYNNALNGIKNDNVTIGEDIMAYEFLSLKMHYEDGSFVCSPAIWNLYQRISKICYWCYCEKSLDQISYQSYCSCMFQLGQNLRLLNDTDNQSDPVIVKKVMIFQHILLMLSREKDMNLIVEDGLWRRIIHATYTEIDKQNDASVSINEIIKDLRMKIWCLPCKDLNENK